MTEPISEPVESDFAGDFFDQWIGGASASRRAVTIYGKPGLYAEYQQIQRQIEIEEAVAEAGEEMGGSPLSALRSRQQEVFDEWEASRTTWILQSTSEDAVEVAKTGLTEPVEPPAPQADDFPDEDALNDAQRAYEAGPLAEYQAAVEQFSDEVNLRLIAGSVVEIRDSAGEVRQTAISVDQLRRMFGTLGKTQLLRLMGGVQEATYGETVIPAPFSQGSSAVAQTS